MKADYGYIRNPLCLLAHMKEIAPLTGAGQDCAASVRGSVKMGFVQYLAAVERKTGRIRITVFDQDVLIGQRPIPHSRAAVLFSSGGITGSKILHEADSRSKACFCCFDCLYRRIKNVQNISCANQKRVVILRPQRGRLGLRKWYILDRSILLIEKGERKSDSSH